MSNNTLKYKPLLKALHELDSLQNVNTFNVTYVNKIDSFTHEMIVLATDDTKVIFDKGHTLEVFLHTDKAHLYFKYDRVIEQIFYKFCTRFNVGFKGSKNA